jgi:hypothetical protein
MVEMGHYFQMFNRIGLCVVIGLTICFLFSQDGIAGFDCVIMFS